MTVIKFVGAALLGLALATTAATPGWADKISQGGKNPPPAATDTADPVDNADIDFGDDTSEWANDGECDDPRFAGEGSADELLDADIGKDATDCQAALDAGTVTYVGQAAAPDVTTTATPAADAIDFGDDTSEWANDGECDDPRFAGEGSADELIDADRGKDATDCQAAYSAGSVDYVGEDGQASTVVGEDAIDYGDDTSEWANDGECDDPRFSGTGVNAGALAEDKGRDAADCKAAVEAGTATFMGNETAQTSDLPLTFDYGGDWSPYANDGECDDLRFQGEGTDKKLLPDDQGGDATDCKTLEEAGKVTIRTVYTPEYAAGAPYDSSAIKFGDDTSSYARDEMCDDPRFEGPGAASILLDSDEMHDAKDCKAAYEAGTVMLVEE